MYALLADILTLSRIVTAGLLAWLGIMYGAEKLPAAVLVTMLTWTTDQLDGWAARRSATPTRLGPYDFPIDATFYLGMLTYLTASGFIPVIAALIFLATAVAAWFWARRKAVGVLCLRLIDLYAGGVVFAKQPKLGFAVLAWLLVLAFLYRRRLAERVPRWLADIRSAGGSNPADDIPSQPFDRRGGPL